MIISFESAKSEETFQGLRAYSLRLRVFQAPVDGLWVMPSDHERTYGFSTPVQHEAQVSVLGFGAVPHEIERCPPIGHKIKRRESR